jgi:hypothetical protein
MRTYTKISALAATILLSSQLAANVLDKNPLIHDESIINALRGLDESHKIVPTALLAANEQTEIIIDDTMMINQQAPAPKEEVLSVPADNRATMPAPVAAPTQQSNPGVLTPEQQLIVAPKPTPPAPPKPADEPVLAANEDGSAYSILLPNNGLIYATQDPSVGDAILNVATIPYVAFASGKISSPLTFYVRSNYSAFIDKMELSIYRKSDTDMIDPVAVVPVKPTPFGTVTWDGSLPSKYNFTTSEELIYVMRAYDKDGRFDETAAKSIQLMKPEDVNDQLDSMRESVSKDQGVQLSNAQASSQYLLDETFASNALIKQNIVIYGSKIVIRGSNIPENTAVLINGASYPIDFERKFTAEYIVPEGEHYFDIGLRGAYQANDKLRVDVSPYYFFGVAIADFTLRKADYDRGSSSESFTENDEDLFKIGRASCRERVCR